MTVLFGVLLCLAAGLLIAGITRRSAHRLSAVALVPLLAVAFSVAPRDGSEDCVTDTTEAAAEVTTTTAAATSTTVAPTTTVPPATTTTTVPRISLSVSTGGVINSISAGDPSPTAITVNSWTGTIGGSNTTFSVTGDFGAVATVSGATCDPVSFTTPATVSCTITPGATSIVLTLVSPV